MNAINLADCKDPFERTCRSGRGGRFDRITRRGKPVARLTAVARPRKPIDAAQLQSLTASMPLQTQAAADLVRSMRDSDRS
jgi:antitoxin (DNA-binding transcriptional repressor) of toxin-antitoxin stability system